MDNDVSKIGNALFGFPAWMYASANSFLSCQLNGTIEALIA